MGQAKKRRACPAVNREIAAAECGENRLSRYACPEQCPFNPFGAANYSALLEAEDAMDLVSMKRMVEEERGAGAAIAAAERANPGHGWHAATVRHLFFHRDAKGRTFAERWEQAGFPGLNNDERVFARQKMKMRVVLLEVHRVLDAQSIEAVDLLEAGGAPMIFVDRSLAARAVRFSTFLTWAYPLPHFWRMSGTGITMDDLGPFSPLEMLEACIVHLGGPPERAAQRGWLAENFERIDHALMATGLERKRQMLARVDASWSAATYELRVSSARARAALEKEPAVVEEQASKEDRAGGFAHAFAWLDDAIGGGAVVGAAAGGRLVLGRVLLGRREWRVEAMGEARFRRLRAAFEARMGTMVAFSRERRDDLGGQMAAQEPPADLALVPPRLLEQPSCFELSSSRLPDPPEGMSMADYSAMLLQNYRRAWLDQRLPVLNGCTPREAARGLESRARLVELVKAQVRRHDKNNLESGRTDDINDWIRELGLTELDFPPPPRRGPPPEFEEGDAAQDDDNDVGEAFGRPMPHLSRPPAPRLCDGPLGFEAARKRIERAMAEFDRAADALKELKESGATVIEDVSALTVDLLSETDFNFLATLLFQAWFALVPRGVRAPELAYDAMEADFDRTCEQLAQGGEIAAAAFARMPDRCRQPGLLEAIRIGLMAASKSVPKAMRPAPDAIPVMLVALKVTLDALDDALRRP